MDRSNAGFQNGKAKLKSTIKITIINRRLPGRVWQAERIVGVIISRKTKKQSEAAKTGKISIFLKDVINGHGRRPGNVFVP